MAMMQGSNKPKNQETEKQRNGETMKQGNKETRNERAMERVLATIS